MRKRLIQLALILTLISIVVTSPASAQDTTTLGTRPFWAGAGFVGMFYAEPDDEFSAMVGGLGYVPVSRVLLGLQGGAIGLGLHETGGYGLIDVGYFLSTRPTLHPAGFYLLLESACGWGADHHRR
jgi:hypothetical protein